MRSSIKALVSPKALAGAFVFVGLAAGSSVAADIPRPVYKAAPAAVVAYNWSGFYGGIHGGYGWGSGDVSIGIVDPAGVTQAAAAAGVFPLAHSIDRDGYVAGGQIGFNQQIGNWLWGVEADFSATGISGTRTEQVQCPVCVAPVRTSVSQDMDWFGTVRARLGYAGGPWLVYATGGLAYGRVEYNYLQTNVPFGGALTITGSDSTVEVGWTVGAGFEIRLPGPLVGQGRVSLLRPRRSLD